MPEFSLLSRSTEETWELARRLALGLGDPLVLAIDGELGSGKTTFVQGVALALGVQGPVTSPTFTLANEYYGERPLYHLDLYRLRSSSDVLASGLADYLEAASGVIAIEWAERARALLTPDAVFLRLDWGDMPEERRIGIRSRRNLEPLFRAESGLLHVPQ